MTALSDTAVTAALKAKLAAEGRVSANQSSITTNNGVVTLEGAVASQADRRKEIDIVRAADEAMPSESSSSLPPWWCRRSAKSRWLPWPRIGGS